MGPKKFREVSTPVLLTLLGLFSTNYATLFLPAIGISKIASAFTGISCILLLFILLIRESEKFRKYKIGEKDGVCVFLDEDYGLYVTLNGYDSQSVFWNGRHFRSQSGWCVEINTNLTLLRVTVDNIIQNEIAFCPSKKAKKKLATFCDGKWRSLSNSASK